MFDLFRSRDKAVRYMLTGLLGVVALSMITYLIPGSGASSGGGGTDPVLAEVGKQKVTQKEVQRAIQNMTRNRQMPAELLGIYAPQIMNQMVLERSMAFEADRLGITVSDDEVDNAIIDQMPPQLIKDNKVDVAALNAILAEQGASLADMKSDTKRQLAVNRLRQIVAQGIVISPREVEDEYHRRNDKIKVEYTILTAAKFQSLATVTDAEMQNYFNGNKVLFQIPEKRSLAVIVLDPEQIGARIVSTDEELKKQYTSDQEKYRVAERVRGRHILVKSDTSNDAAMKAKAEGLLKQIKGGGDFAELAKKNSDDPGSGANGGELGWFQKGQMVPEFEKSAFSLAPGQTSGLVKTMFGYHIIQVEEKENAHLKPFEEVKAELAADYKKRSVNSQLQQLSDKALAELRKDALHPEKAAAIGGTIPVLVNNVQVGDPIPQVGVSKEFDSAVSGLKKGEVTAGPVVLTGGKVVIASVTDYFPAHQAKLEEVKNEIKTKVEQSKLQSILNQKVNELVKTAQSTGDLAKAAKDMGVELKTSGDVDRNAAVEGVGTGSIIDEAYSKPVGTVVGPINAQGGRVVVKVISKTPADLGALAAQSNSIRDELKQKKGRDRGQLFEEGLKGRLEKEGKLKVYKEIQSRIIEGFKQRS